MKIDFEFGEGNEMPIYEYRCENCSHLLATLIIGENDHEIICPKCNEKQVNRLLSVSSFMEKPNPAHSSDSSSEFL